MATPNAVPVYFAGETLQPTLDSLVATYLASANWTAAVSEYGVGRATKASSIALTETAAGMLLDVDVQSWLASKLDGSHPEFAPVDAATLSSKVFLLFYPSTTWVTRYYCDHCAPVSYHSGLVLPTGAKAYYAVLPRWGGGGVDALSSAFAQELVDVATDPTTDPLTGGGYQGVDPAHALFLGGGEVATLGCMYDSSTKPAGLGMTIPRTWSNRAAAAYHEPCLPVPDGAAGAYFNSVPAMVDDVSYYGTATKGIKVPIGGSATVDVQLFSDGPTTGPWTIAARDIASTFTITLDRTTGSDGDVLHLTASAPRSNVTNGFLLVTSTLGPRTTYWIGALQSQ